MTVYDILRWISLGVILFYGFASLIRPRFVAQNLEHVLPTGRGVSEFRILHGGFYLGLACFALYANHPLVDQALGWSWIGAGLIRLPAYFADKPTLPLSVTAFVAELALGVFLLL